ncbi:hypothetical protein ACFLTU_07135 [Bacteroidota bacterium]
MTNFRYSIIIFICGACFLLGSSCEITQVIPDDDEDPVENQGNKLVQVIEDDNIWGGKVILEVDRVMSLLHKTKYTLSNYVTEVEDGRLDVDCSKYVETIMKEASLIHYQELPKSSKSGLTSLAKDYYNHFVTLPYEPDESHCWIRIENLEDARPGDIISYIHAEQGNTTGHVMIICSYPKPSEFSPVDYSLDLNDAASSGHFGDTRNKEGIYSEDYTYIPTLHFDDGQMKYSGIGIGTMWFHIGSNSYYRWNSESGRQVYKSIAIGRMIDPII